MSRVKVEGKAQTAISSRLGFEGSSKSKAVKAYWVLNLFIICFLLQCDYDARLIKWGESEVSRHIFMVPEYKDIWGETRSLYIFRPVQASKLSGPVVTVQNIMHRLSNIMDRLSKWNSSQITDASHILVFSRIDLFGRSLRLGHAIYLWAVAWPRLCNFMCFIYLA